MSIKKIISVWEIKKNKKYFVFEKKPIHLTGRNKRLATDYLCINIYNSCAHDPRIIGKKMYSNLFNNIEENVFKFIQQ